MTQETVVCNLCGAASATPRYQVKDLLLERPTVTATLVECAVCGLVYQNPRPTFAAMGEHYPDEYDSYNYDSDDKRPSWLLRKAYAYGTNKRTRIVTRAKSGGRLLDIGCSTGLFLRGMREKSGWEVQGVEISEQAAAIARNRHALTVTTGTLESAEFPDNHFDAVTMWDVFEHLHDPDGSLAEIRRILRPDGVLVLRVPNLDSWDAQLFGENWAGLDAPRHLYIFGRKTLTQILTQNSFKIAKMSCAIGSYPTFVLSVRFWLTAQAKPRERMMRLLNSPPARLLSAPLFYLLGMNQRGPLLTVVARNG